MVIMIIRMGSLVKDGELTETPYSDFPHRSRYLAQGAVKRHLINAFCLVCGVLYCFDLAGLVVDAEVDAGGPWLS